MSGSLRDLARLIRGVSLIVRNAAKRSQTLDDLERGDLNAVIATSVKKSVVFAAEISGLTKGVVHKCARSLSRERESSFYSSHSVSKHIPDEKRNPGDVVQSIRKDSAVADSGNVELFSDLEASVSGDLPRVSTGGGDNCNFNLDNAVLNENNDNEGEMCWDSGQEGRKKIGTTRGMRIPRERKVPSTAFSRAIGFAGLGVGLAWGTVQESVKRLAFGTSKLQEEQSSISPFLSEKNAERLAAGLCRMRGAALKIGQMFSIQDQSLVPPPILAALDIVRHGADMMPKRQLNHVLDVELGPEWSTQKLASFDYNPIAAASIGQVHRAVTKDGLQVAIKIQYPGVADSIESDIENVKLLLNYTNLIPKGLFLDNAMKVAKEELSRECNYELEAANQKRFRKLISNINGFYVPAVIDDMSSKRILTTELVSGIPVDKVAFLNQGVRNYVGKKLLELTLMELFVFRFMQTDPNWSNFMYEEGSGVINLVDFGAAREYPKCFVDDYLGMVLACADGDREGVIEMSKRLGFLTGMESEVMIETHVEAGFVVGMPFSKPGVYDFRSGEIARSITHLGATMLKYRQAPPPDEAYSLHRKLSGAFLTCIRLGSVVPCRDLLLRVCGLRNHTS